MDCPHFHRRHMSVFSKGESLDLFGCIINTTFGLRWCCIDPSNAPGLIHTKTYRDSLRVNRGLPRESERKGCISTQKSGIFKDHADTHKTGRLFFYPLERWSLCMLSVHTRVQLTNKHFCMTTHRTANAGILGTVTPAIQAGLTDHVWEIDELPTLIG